MKKKTIPLQATTSQPSPAAKKSSAPIEAKGTKQPEEGRRPGQFAPDSALPNDDQRKVLCEMLFNALVEIRFLLETGHVQQAHDLTDAFHSLPDLMWQDQFSLSLFRKWMIVPYCKKWPKLFQCAYLPMLDEVERLK